MTQVVFKIALTFLLVINIFAVPNEVIQNKIKVGLNPITGDTSKINQDSMRQSMAKYLNAKGFSANLVESSKDAGKYDFFITVDIKNGERKSETIITATLYGKDGKTVIGQTKTSRSGTDDDSLRKIRGTDDDSLRPVIIKLLDGLTEKMNR